MVKEQALACFQVYCIHNQGDRYLTFPRIIKAEEIIKSSSPNRFNWCIDENDVLEEIGWPHI